MGNVLWAASGKYLDKVPWATQEELTGCIWPGGHRLLTADLTLCYGTVESYPGHRISITIVPVKKRHIRYIIISLCTDLRYPG